MSDSNSPCQVLFLLIWPIISIIFGTISGILFGTLISILVLLLTTIRLPLNIFKTIKVNLTCDKPNLFNCHLGLLMRILVLPTTPLVHLSFLLIATIFALTVGNLFYIGKATKIIYKREFKKTMKTGQQNARLEPKSHLGKYYKKQLEFFEKDDGSIDILYCCKAVMSVFPGFILGILPVIPFTLAVLGISLIRFPVNLFKTMKIAVFTVVLRWDLKILTIISLPVIHIFFVIFMFFLGFFASFGYFIGYSIHCVYKGYELSKTTCWLKFNEFIKEYWKMHQEFVGKYCEVYDVPYGIPNGWRGEVYGIPVERILKIQWKFILGVFFSGYSLILVSSGCKIVYLIQVLPMTFQGTYRYVEKYFKQSLAVILGSWPFFLAGLPLIICGIPVLYILILGGFTVYSLKTPYVVLRNNSYRQGFYEPFNIISSYDDLCQWLSSVRLLNNINFNYSNRNGQMNGT